MNQCIRLVESLTKFSKTKPVNEVKQAMHGIISVLGNLRMVHFWYFWKINIYIQWYFNSEKYSK